MSHRVIATLGLSALVMGGFGASANHPIVGSANAADAGPTAALAASEAAKARKALDKGKPDQAVAAAEAAVRYSPNEASYRALLGQAYLQDGRFVSAQTALSDSLMLAPGTPKVALSLALAKIANGDWVGARQTLDDNSAVIPVSDRGLALALAGDPVTAVALLNDAARTPEADAKTRQNLALSLALAGRWSEARAVAAVDIAPNEIDQRLMDWALFAHPRGAADQVAALLGVTPVQDPGFPVALALSAPAPALANAVDAAPAMTEPSPPIAVAAAEPVPADPVPAEPVAAKPVAADPAPMAAPVMAMVSPAPVTGAVVFGVRREIVQALPIHPHNLVTKAAMVKPSLSIAPMGAGMAKPEAAAPQKGNFYVQIGAYQNAAVARDGWNRAKRRFPAFGAHMPSGMDFKTGSSQFYRLSVGGFTRPDAVSMCLRYRRAGGKCFVRADAGDQTAQWLDRQVRQLASR